MNRLALIIFSVLTLNIYSQDRTRKLEDEHAIYNLILNDYLGEKECNKFCQSKRIRKEKKGKLAVSTVQIDNFNDELIELYFNSLENKNDYFIRKSEVDSVNISSLIHRLKSNRALAKIDSSKIRNNRKDWLIVFNEEELKTICRLCISAIELDEKTNTAIVYVVIDYGPLAGKGVLYIFEKESNYWNQIIKWAMWVS